MSRVERGLFAHEQRHADALVPCQSASELLLPLLLASPLMVWLMRWPSWQQVIS